MNWQALAFGILALVILVSAWKVVTSRLITHSALYLALTFVGVAGVFLLLEADFLAAVQVLIYVGAIITMIIFAVMLSNIREIKDMGKVPLWRIVVSPQWGLFPLIIAAGFAALMAAIYGRASWPAAGGAMAATSTVAIARELFTTYLIPFEVASVLLLVAMIGAIVLTMKEDA